MIVEALQSGQPISTLDLWGCRLNKERLNILISALGKYRRLAMLDLGDNVLGDDGCAIICKFARTATLTSLVLDGNQLSDTSGPVIADMLASNPVLQILELRNNGFGNSSAVLIADALTQNKTLRKLNLYHNCVGGSGARALCAMLRVNKTITSLDLRCNAVPSQSLLEAVHQLCSYNQRGVQPNIADMLLTGTESATIRTIANAGLAASQRSDDVLNDSGHSKSLLQRISEQLESDDSASDDGTDM